MTIDSYTAQQLPTILSLWETWLSIVEWASFKTFLLETLRTQNQSREELYVFFGSLVVSISWTCKKQTPVSHSSTESEVIILDASLRMDGLPALDQRDVVGGSVAIPRRIRNHQPNKRAQRNLSLKTNIKLKKQRKPRFRETVRCGSRCHKRHFFSMWISVVYFRRPWGGNKKWSSKAEVQRWDTFPEPTELCLIGCLIEFNLDPKNSNQVHRHQKPTRRHADKGKFHTWWMESSFAFVQHQSFQFHQ